MTDAVWRARSASDRTDDWPFWYVTDDKPQDRNRTIDAIELMIGQRIVGLPFVPREVAEKMAAQLNARGQP